MSVTQIVLSRILHRLHQHLEDHWQIIRFITLCADYQLSTQIVSTRILLCLRLPAHQRPTITLAPSLRVRKHQSSLQFHCTINICSTLHLSTMPLILSRSNIHLQHSQGHIQVMTLIRLYRVYPRHRDHPHPPLQHRPVVPPILVHY